MNVEPSSRAFFDTNILVYAYDYSAGDKQRIAADLVAKAWNEQTGCLSVQVLQEFYVTVTQKIKEPIPVKTAKQIIEDLAQWAVQNPQAEDVLRAIELQDKCQLSFWDAMILRSALCLGCSTLYSEDLQSGCNFGGTLIVNPFL